MNEQMMKERIQQALNVKMSGVRTSLAERSRLYENAIGGTKVKRKMTVGLVFAIVLVLMTAAAVAAILLTHQEIVEQVAVPLAVDNDGELGVKQNYSAEELAELVRNLNENGITLEENNAIMQALKTGKGFYEEEAIMEICRQAFGRHYSTWTLEEQDWFSRMMVDIGFYESYESCLPGEENLTYEQAEAYAFSGLKKKYGEKVEPEDRINYYLERSFHPESEEEGEATWYFTLVPMNMEHGRYEIVFRDREPETSMWIREEIRDWSKPYKAEELVQAFESIYGWNRGNWEQTVWQKLHEMMQDAKIDLYAESRREYKGYQMTEYPEPEKNEITRADAIRIAREAMKEKQVAMESAVLTEFEGKRVWLAAWITGSEEDEVLDKIAECYVVTVDSRTGNVESVRTQTADDDLSMAYVPEAAYLKAGEGLVPRSERIKQAIDTVAKAYPGLDLLNEDEYETDLYLEEYDIRLNFHSKNIRHGNVKALVSRDGRIKEMTADEEKLNGDNLFDRYRLVYGYFGKWDQKIWVQLVKDMEPLEPETPEGKLLETNRYPEEDTVRINHTEAMKLAIKASGKRTAEINTCVLISANPHPVWKLRVISYGDDDWVDQVIELDAETGEVLAKEVYKTDYTPDYVLFSLEKNRRAMELKELGPVEIARREVAYAFGDMSADYPEPEFDDPEQYEIRVDGLNADAGYLDAEDAEELKAELQELLSHDEYVAVKSSRNGLDLDVFSEDDLIFDGFSYLAMQPATLPGETEQELIDNGDGTWLMRCDGDGYEAVFNCDEYGNNARILSFQILDEDTEGPRCVRLGDLFSEDFCRFRSGESEMDGDMTELLYGTADTVPRGVATYDPAEMSLRYVTDTASGEQVELILRYETNILDEIILHTLQ